MKIKNLFLTVLMSLFLTFTACDDEGEKADPDCSHELLDMELPEGGSLAGTEPVEAGTEPVEAGTEPVEAGTEPVEAGTEPVEAGTELPPEGGSTDPLPEGGAEGGQQDAPVPG